MSQIEEDDDVVILEIGAGHAVPTIRSKGEHLARKHNGTLIRINPRDTDLSEDSDKHVAFAAGGLAVLDRLEQHLY